MGDEERREEDGEKSKAIGAKRTDGKDHHLHAFMLQWYSTASPPCSYMPSLPPVDSCTTFRFVQVDRRHPFPPRRCSQSRCIRNSSTTTHCRPRQQSRLDCSPPPPSWPTHTCATYKPCPGKHLHLLLLGPFSFYPLACSPQHLGNSGPPVLVRLCVSIPTHFEDRDSLTSECPPLSSHLVVNRVRRLARHLEWLDFSWLSSPADIGAPSHLPLLWRTSFQHSRFCPPTLEP